MVYNTLMRFYCGIYNIIQRSMAPKTKYDSYVIVSFYLPLLFLHREVVHMSIHCGGSYTFFYCTSTKNPKVTKS